VSEYTPGCACAPPHTDGDQCACPCHEPDPVERTLAIVSGRVYLAEGHDGGQASHGHDGGAAVDSSGPP